MEMWQAGAFEVPFMGLLQSESSFSAGAADTTSALHKRSAALKVPFTSDHKQTPFFNLFFFFHLSILKSFCYISCIQKSLKGKKKQTKLLDKEDLNDYFHIREPFLFV